MSNTNFKHILKEGESRLESLGLAVTFYVWERPLTPAGPGPWMERSWSFEIFAQTKDGVTATGFVVHTHFKPDVGSIPAQKIETFKDLDDASRWVNDQVSQKMAWGYRTVRAPAPDKM